MSANDLVTLREAGEMLRVSGNTMRRWLRLGYVPGAKPGRDWRIRRVDVEKLLEEVNDGRGSVGATEPGG